jgi:hypothetical protein
MIPFIAFSIGCGAPHKVGTPIEKSKVDMIVPGTTPESKVVEMFGQPFKKESMGAGESKSVYTYYEEQPRFWTKNVVIKHTLEVYTKDGIVQKYDLKKEGIEEK